jgi:hypothetical protein
MKKKRYQKCHTTVPFSSNGLQEHLAAFPKVSQHTFGRFLLTVLEAVYFCRFRLKTKDATEQNLNVFLLTMLDPTIPLYWSHCPFMYYAPQVECMRN